MYIFSTFSDNWTNLLQKAKQFKKQIIPQIPHEDPSKENIVTHSLKLRKFSRTKNIGAWRRDATVPDSNCFLHALAYQIESNEIGAADYLRAILTAEMLNKH
jgi:hypothetical protein